MKLEKKTEEGIGIIVTDQYSFNTSHDMNKIQHSQTDPPFLHILYNVVA
jgi:hypothetical protein